ncbi:MAG: glycosyltransferase family 2 protein, partial [Anaerolineae bacterium]|nr:glycosyltransferase family 2 protein [Anaerolineae bacterium]
WKVRELALDALETLLADLQAEGPHDSQVWLVDNDSGDGTVEAVSRRFPQVHMLASDENLGFAAGNNLALRSMGFGSLKGDALPRAVYLLNPDTQTQAGATSKLYQALFANKGVGLVGAQLSYEDGSFQHSAFKFPGLRQLWAEFFPLPGRLIEGTFNGRYPRKRYAAGKPFRIDFPLGATMMLRREVIETTGMFDENFALYCEEIDWAWRIRKAGWQAFCVPAARVTHLDGRSSAQARPESVLKLWRSRAGLFRKHYPQWREHVARRLIIKGLRRRLQNHERNPELREVYRTLISELRSGGGPG